jgi:ribonuclease BN (tRNA processing enzyme)
MKLAFLGSGAAFSLERYNGAVVVEDRFLLDAGAPLLPHMHRLGIDPGGIEAVLLTHLHGDHILGLPTFVLYRAFFPSEAPLPLLGPPGTEEVLERLFTLSWGEAWAQHRQQAQLEYRVTEENGWVAGVPYEAVKLEHGSMDCRGYRLRLDGRLLAYAGDTTASAPLEKLVSGADVAITEATAPGGADSHTSWEEAKALAERHPGTRFLFNHVFEGEVPCGVHDLEVVDA